LTEFHLSVIIKISINIALELHDGRFRRYAVNGVISHMLRFVSLL
jgi:hypothetical protein